LNKLRVLKASDAEAFETLKLLVKSAKGYERTVLPKAGINMKAISALEKNEFIFTYDYKDYVVLNQRIKTLIDKI
jgi:hypothetical protein